MSPYEAQHHLKRAVRKVLGSRADGYRKLLNGPFCQRHAALVIRCLQGDEAAAETILAMCRRQKSIRRGHGKPNSNRRADWDQTVTSATSSEGWTR